MAAFHLYFQLLALFVARCCSRLVSLPIEQSDSPLHAGGSDTWISIVCTSGASIPYNRPPYFVPCSRDSSFGFRPIDPEGPVVRTTVPKLFLKGHRIGAGEENASRPSIDRARTDRDRLCLGGFVRPRPARSSKKHDSDTHGLPRSNRQDRTGAAMPPRGLVELRRIAADIPPVFDR